MEDGDLALQIEPSADGALLGAPARAEAFAETNRLLTLSYTAQAKGTR